MSKHDILGYRLVVNSAVVTITEVDIKINLEDRKEIIHAMETLKKYEKKAKARVQSRGSRVSGDVVKYDFQIVKGLLRVTVTEAAVG